MEVKSPFTCPNSVTVRRNPHRKARASPFINPPENFDHATSSSSVMPQISSFPLPEILSMEMSRPPKDEDSFPESSVSQPPLSENLKVYLRIRPVSVSKISGQGGSLGHQNGKPKFKNAWPQNPAKKNSGREKNTRKKNVEVCLSVNDSKSVILSPPVALQETKRIKSEVYEGFSHVFTSESSQNEVFEKMVSPLVEDFLNGKSGMIAALGPSGSGKSHTIFGSARDPGIVPLTFQYIFKQAESQDPDSTRSFSLSIFEIYSERSKVEKIYDLLADGAEVNMQQTIIKGLKEVIIYAPREAESIVGCAMSKRNTASTNANSTSSRSQCIINIRHLACKLDEGGLPSSNEAGVVLKIVDLAGAEREKRTGNKGSRLLEANFINNTSMVLGLCLRSLYEYQKNPKKPLEKHFQNSLLTKYLRDYLEGKKRMTLILTVKPGAEDYSDTSYVLRQAAPFMKIKFQTVDESSNLSHNKRQLPTLFTVEQPKRVKLSALEACVIEGKSHRDENLLHQEVVADGSENQSLKLVCAGSAEKERSHLIMQNFAKAVWNVLKEYRDKLKISEGEVQSLREQLVTQTKRSTEMEEQLKNLKCQCTCSNETHLERLTAVDESFTCRLDVNEINVDISPKLECTSASTKCSSLSKQDFKELPQKSKDISNMNTVIEDFNEYILESISGKERDTHSGSKHLEAEPTISTLVITRDESSSVADLDSQQGNETEGLKDLPLLSGAGATCIKQCENVEMKNDDPGTATWDQPTAGNSNKSDSNSLVADEEVYKQLQVLDAPPVRSDCPSTEKHSDADLPAIARRTEKPKRRLLPASSALLRDFNTLHIDEDVGKLKGNGGAKKEAKDEKLRTQGNMSLLRMLRSNLHP